MKIRQFLLCIVVLMSCMTIGCSSVGNRLDYLQSGGRAEIEGEMDGLAFRGVITIAAGGDEVSIEYLAPTDLCGLVILVDGEACRVRLGDVQFNCDVSEVSGFLRPVVAFLPQGETKSVQKDGKNTVLVFPSEQTLTLSEQGEPIAFTGENLWVRVVWWQSSAPAEQNA